MGPSLPPELEHMRRLVPGAARSSDLVPQDSPATRGAAEGGILARRSAEAWQEVMAGRTSEERVKDAQERQPNSFE